MTPKDRKKIVKDFFDKAEAKNLIVYKNHSQFSEITKRVIKERQKEAQTFQDFWDIFRNPKKLTTLEQVILKEFNIKDKSTNTLVSNFFIFHALNYLEINKMILKEFIDPTKKIGKKKFKITETITLNQLIISLAQEVELPDFEKLVPKHFRNVLGHSAWYFENNEFCYFDEKQEKVSLTENKFMDLMTETSLNFEEIINEWDRRKTKRIKSKK